MLSLTLKDDGLPAVYAVHKFVLSVVTSVPRYHPRSALPASPKNDTLAIMPSITKESITR